MPLEVNGETIDDSLIRQEARALRPRMMEAMVEDDPVALEMRVREWARENVIERVLLRQAAAADPEPIAAELLEKAVAQARGQTPGQSGCIFPAADEALRREVELQLRVDRLVERLGARVSAPRHKDVVEYYRKHKQSFFTAEMVHAAHIVRNVDENTDEAAALAAIREAEAELRHGVPFAEVADRRSDCPGRGGDLGWFAAGQMVDEFDKRVFAMQPGEVSEIFRSPFGFHIATVRERRPAGLRSLEKVRDQIEATLLAEKRQRALEQFLDRLRARADIQPAKA